MIWVILAHLYSLVILISESSALWVRTRELCESIIDDPQVAEWRLQVERFLDDDSARLQYQSVHERGEELHHKQHAGVELGSQEIREFELAREALFENEVARGFIDAQRQLEGVRREIDRYLSLTIELGRVPTEDDIAEASGGCCGGGGGGCGCSH